MVKLPRGVKLVVPPPKDRKEYTSGWLAKLTSKDTAEKAVAKSS